MIDAAHGEEIQFLYTIGDALAGIANRSFAAEALARVPFRVHQDIVLNSSMILEPHDVVLLLPGQTRYEQRSGGTATSNERRIRFTPEIPGHYIGESLADWEIPALMGRAAMSNGELLFPFAETHGIREEMARVMPIYRGIETLHQEGDQMQWGGPSLYQGGFFNMPNSKARFTVIEPPDLSEHKGSASNLGKRSSSTVSRLATPSADNRDSRIAPRSVSRRQPK
jgi:predicted molibdopterin-dependent oxidoreductase YjgC